MFCDIYIHNLNGNLAIKKGTILLNSRNISKKKEKKCVSSVYVFSGVRVGPDLSVSVL